MFNKILLACAGSGSSQLVARVSIVVGERSSNGLIERGYYASGYGVTKPLGSCTILEQTEELGLIGIFAVTDSGTTTSGIEIENPVSMSFTLENETNGVLAKCSFSGQNNGYQFLSNVDLFEGIKVGQTCVISIYK